jgi:UDP-glucose 4-epimerase
MINDARQAAEDPAAEITLGADKGYDAQEFIEACQEMKVTPHVAQNTSSRRSSVPDTLAARRSDAAFAGLYFRSLLVTLTAIIMTMAKRGKPHHVRRCC